MKFLLPFLISGLVFISCSKDKAKEVIPVSESICDSIPKSFATDVQPIFNSNCVSCHNVANNFANGQSWETHAEISANIESILTAVKHEPGKTPMPFQQPKLSDSLIRVIECWAADGAKNN